MKYILYFFLCVSSSLLLGSCASMERARVQSQFIQEFEGIHHDHPLYVLETIPYENEEAEPRYRFVGTFPQEERERWALVWADYGKVGKHRWIPLEYPATPFAFAPTFEKAEEAAKAHRLTFMETSQTE